MTPRGDPGLEVTVIEPGARGLTGLSGHQPTPNHVLTHANALLSKAQKEKPPRKWVVTRGGLSRSY